MAGSAVPPLDADRLAHYLHRLGLGDRDASTIELADLCLAHLMAVPFENLDQVFADGVEHDLDIAVDKILGGRGGWCFELNGAFAGLLTSLGFDVLFLGCAVLLDGPSRTVDHLALEVSGGPAGIGPRLVDVGFGGPSFVLPLDLNEGGPQPGGDADRQLFPSPEGTTLTRLRDGVPEAQYRFKRVALDYDTLRPIATSLQSDPSLTWSSRPLVTRLIDVGDRVTLHGDTWTRTADGSTTRRTVPPGPEWDSLLTEWFGLSRPGDWPDDVQASAAGAG